MLLECGECGRCGHRWLEPSVSLQHPSHPDQDTSWTSSRSLLSVFSTSASENVLQSISSNYCERPKDGRTSREPMTIPAIHGRNGIRPTSFACRSAQLNWRALNCEQPIYSITPSSCSVIQYMLKVKEIIASSSRVLPRGTCEMTFPLLNHHEMTCLGGASRYRAHRSLQACHLYTH